MTRNQRRRAVKYGREFTVALTTVERACIRRGAHEWSIASLECAEHVVQAFEHQRPSGGPR